MSEQYYCPFCDTVVFASDELRPHLTQHLTLTDDNSRERRLTAGEDDFVDRLVDYEMRLNESIHLLPKELPKDTVPSLLIGCPSCDAIIKCFDLIPSKRIDKQVCYCGQPSNRRSVYQCDQCFQVTHYSCARTICSLDSESMKCMYCSSKEFEISYLKCKSAEEQRMHCYQHLLYFPFKCQFEIGTDGEICGQNLFEFKQLRPHLENEHNYRVDDNKDIYFELSSYFQLISIQKIDALINTHLNSKYMPPFAGNPGITVSPTGAELVAPKRFMTGIGLCESNGFENQFIDISDDKKDFSFQYSSQTFAERLSNNKTIPKRNQSNTSRDFDKRLELDLDLSDISDTSIKRLNESYSTVSAAESGICEVASVLADSDLLRHKRNYQNWFNETKRIKFPYFPQKDDDLYYIPYGHELYRNEVFARRLYCTANKHNSMKYFLYDKILANVAKIDFQFKVRRKDQTVIRCVYITLKPYDKKYGTICHVKYHDLSGVVDFLILKEHYESSVEVEWNVGDEFRSIIGNKYWFGVIVGINSQPFCQQTMFKKYQIKWHSTNELDWLSPWDLEPIENGLFFNKRSHLPVTDIDRQSFFKSLPEEWPKYNEKQELKRIANGLKIILNMDKTKEFPLLVDITDSCYKEKILYPVDMKTFISRVENRYYRRHLAIKYDIKFLEANIRKLIKSVKRDPEYRFDEDIAKRLKYHTKFVTALCLLFIDTLECKNPYELYNNIDDYIETHDVKCYSAKRVHLNLVKKHPNLLPVPQKRQSFSRAHKTFKIFNALKNTHFLSRKSKPNVSTANQLPLVECKPKPKPKPKLKPKSKSKPKHKSETQPNPNTIQVPVVSYLMARTQARDEGTSDEVLLSDSDSLYDRLDSCDGFNAMASSPNVRPIAYSSDVSVSEFDYNYYNDCPEPNDSESDPDFQTTYYYKNKF